MTPRERTLPWSGFVLGAIGWVVSQQWGSARVTDACLIAWSWQTFLLGVIGLAFVLAGAAVSWRVRRDSSAPAARFVSTVSVAADVVFALAIVFHTVAILIIPRCFS